MYAVWTYLAYLTISVGVTVFVGRTLHKNGRVFLVDSFLGNAELADSVNRLLVVGFYLINIGFVSLAMRFGGGATSAQQALEFLSTQIGLVLLILGVMHFLNILIFSRMRRRAMAGNRRPQYGPPTGGDPTQPVPPPDAHWSGGAW